jgi:hypothetical protein
MWSDTSFFYTVYIGFAASALGGHTIVKSSGMFTTTVSKIYQMEWTGMQILIIDKISFATKQELTKLDVRLCQF